jgi:hypothetical protein
MRPSPLLAVIERLRAHLEAEEHALLAFLADDDQALGVVQTLDLHGRHRIILTDDEIRQLRSLLEDSAN